MSVAGREGRNHFWQKHWKRHGKAQPLALYCSKRLRRHLLSYSIINARSPPVRSLVRIGVLLAERLQVVGVRLAAAQRATRYLGGNRVLLSGLPA